MDPNDEFCDHCGAKVVEYKHSLSAGLAGALRKFSGMYGLYAGELSLVIQLTYSERCNFQKLRYWGLVKKMGDQDGKGGMWNITAQGNAWLRGDTTVSKHVWTYRAQVRRFEGEPVHVEEVLDGWRWRPDYRGDAAPHDPNQKKLF